MPADDARSAAEVAAEGTVVYLTDHGRRVAAVVPPEVADTALVLDAAARTRARLADFEAAAHAAAGDPEVATARMLNSGDGPPNAAHFARILRAEGTPGEQAAIEAEHLAAQAAEQARRLA